MKYMTTRGGETASAERAIVQGLGADGGLFVPESFPQVTKYDLRDMAALNYNERAVRILERFLPALTITASPRCTSCPAAYTSWSFITARRWPSRTWR